MLDDPESVKAVLADARAALLRCAEADAAARSHYIGRVIDLTRLEEALVPPLEAPSLDVRPGAVAIGQRWYPCRLGGAKLASVALARGEADASAFGYRKPNAVREALRRFAKFVENTGNLATARRVYEIRVEKDLRVFRLNR